jgi:hypothetical protein
MHKEFRANTQCHAQKLIESLGPNKHVFLLPNSIRNTTININMGDKLIGYLMIRLINKKKKTI